MRTMSRESATARGTGGALGSLIRRHRTGAVVAAVVTIAAVALALYWFEPWQLFVDRSVHEAPPGAPAVVEPSGTGANPEADAGAGPEAGTGSGHASPAPAGPSVLARGEFRGLEHETSGTVKVLELADGSRYVRLEGLRTSNGPDLVVLLSDTPATEDSWGAYDNGRTVLLGELKGNIGDQNYPIPAGVEPSRFRSVVIWCRRFAVGFGAAPIASG